MEFSGFDARGYRTVDVRTGYVEWVASYEDTVEDVMDLALLERLVDPVWPEVARAADLGCGTGRTGEWLRGKGVARVDGVDVTPEMLDLARRRGAHDRLVEGDAISTGLESGSYDLVICSLIDEHLADLGPLYAEAYRLAAPKASFVLVTYHPHFIMTSGMPTHYTNAAGENVAISTNVHLISDHARAGLRAGWRLAELHEGVIDDDWLAVKPKWERFRDHPISAAYAWRKDG
ncbi:class I SAM-dependent DNA methyltransferase [Saccharopolyspora griseoalba]|uniref:Class I SAM-dependent DNA methyltransferase n=1 Tax=Saccharopolyspora griseoalba TaxID=1431848 RepID=A0ABW2LII0_9PSEU